MHGNTKITQSIFFTYCFMSCKRNFGFRLYLAFAQTKNSTQISMINHGLDHVQKTHATCCSLSPMCGLIISLHPFDFFTI
jgi:hypothetical protein